MTKEDKILGSAGQAGTLGSFSQDSGGLRFDTQDDAFDFARKIAEDGRRWARERGFSCAKDYLRGRSEIRIHFTARMDAHDLKFVAKMVPFISDGKGPLSVSAPLSHEKTGYLRYSDNTLVFIGSGEGGDRVEQFIPSVVSVECAQEGSEFPIDAPAPGVEFIIELLRRSRDWKKDALAVISSEKHSRVANGLVERVPQIINDAARLKAEPPRNLGGEADFEHFISGLRVNVLDDFVSATFDEGFARFIEVGDACFCPIDE